MNNQRPFHLDMLTHDPDTIRQHACNTLNDLLGRVSMNLVSDKLNLSRTTLYRYIDPEYPLESLNLHVAMSIIFLCETQQALIDCFNRAPSPTAYFERELAPGSEAAKRAAQ